MTSQSNHLLFSDNLAAFQMGLLLVGLLLICWFVGCWVMLVCWCWLNGVGLT